MAINYNKIIRHIKSDSFLGKFFEMMDDCETPYAYDFWAALWTLSVAVGRGTFISRPHAPVWLNLYVILAASSGVTRKSTAVRRVENLVMRFRECSPDKSIYPVTAKMTTEALLRQMSKLSHEHMTIHTPIIISELVTFMGKEAYLTSMPGMLTDLYDCPDYRESAGTVVGGSVQIVNAWVGLLSASTPTWLLNSVNPNIIEGGFTSRCLFIHAEKRKKKIAWGEGKTHNIEPMIDMMLDIQDMAKNVIGSTGIRITPAALKIFSRWYNGRSESDDPYTASFEAREDGHILKLAALLGINRNTWEIGADDLNTAIKIIQEIKSDGRRLFDLQIPQQQFVFEDALERIRYRLLSKGTEGYNIDELVRSMRDHAPSEVVRKIIAVIHELKMVDIVVERIGGKEFQKVFAKETLLKPEHIAKAIQEVMSD